MLVLSRTPGESIRLNDEIVITVVQIRGGRVRLGIEAPASVRVSREPGALSPSRVEMELDLGLPAAAGAGEINHPTMLPLAPVVEATTGVPRGAGRGRAVDTPRRVGARGRLLERLGVAVDGS